jgi:uncharacterized protein YqeY
MVNLDRLIKEALMSGNRVELNAYKNLKAEIQRILTAKNAKGCPEIIIKQVAAKYAKTLKDSIEQFQEAGRDDLVAEYTSELEVIQKLLPAPVAADQIEKFIKNDEKYFDQFWVSEFIDDGEATTMKLQIPKKEMGTAIKYLKSQFPTADGKLLSLIVKNHLV